MEAAERLARLEAKVEFLTETVDRNREEGKHDRANMRMALDGLGKLIEDQNERLSGLLSTMDQVSGAKKTLWTIGAILSFFGLAGLYQVASWLGVVRPHP